MKPALSLLFASGLIANAVAVSPAPAPKPKLGMLEAIQKARAYAESKVDLSHHYLDRVWIGPVGRNREQRWIVSWSPDGPDVKNSPGWVFATVDMDGKVSEPKGGVSWLDGEMVDALVAMELAKRRMEELQKKLLPSEALPEKPKTDEVAPRVGPAK